MATTLTAQIFLSTLYFQIVILGIVFLGITVFRLSTMLAELLIANPNDSWGILISVMAAVFDLICILGLNYAYETLSFWLTDKEFHRTQKDFDDSLIMKMYVFQFLNYYSSFFYIAFFKGRFIGTPDSYIRLFLFNSRQEEVRYENLTTVGFLSWRNLFTVSSWRLFW